MNNGGRNVDEMMNKAKQALSGGTSGNAQIDRMISSLKPEDVEKLKKVLSDRKTAERIIATPQAQKLLNTFMKNGDMNG